MTEQEVRDLTAKHMPRLIKELGISSVTVYTFYEAVEIGKPITKMATDVNSVETYRYAQITIYWRLIENEEEFVRSLMHELLHIHLAPFELFAQTWDYLIKDNQKDAFRKMYRHVVERTVTGLEIGLNEGKFKSDLPIKKESNGKH